MALDPNILLQGARVPQVDLQAAMRSPFQGAALLNQIQQIPLQNQLLQQRAALNEQDIQQGQQQLDQAEMQRFVLGARTAINAFERGDSNGVVRTILDTFQGNPQAQAQELAEFNNDPESYIAQAKDFVGAMKAGQTQTERFSPTTTTLPDGTTIQTTSTGRKVVTDAGGNVLTGSNAAKAVRQGEEFKTEVQRQRAEVRTTAKGEASRGQDIINQGLAAADSTAPIRRGLQLLEGLETGGVDRVSFAAKQFFGVESGDEGELSNLLGKAVLSQLRSTFGAAFTAKEGESLAKIEAGIGKSPAANRRLLRNALRIAERTGKRAIDRATENKDFRTAAEIQESLDFDLGDIPSSQSQQAPAAAPAPFQEGQTATNPQTGERIIFNNGQWQPAP